MSHLQNRHRIGQIICRLFGISLLLLFTQQAASASPKLRLGIEVLLSDHLDMLKGKRVGLVTNHTGTDSKLVSDIDLLRAWPEVNLVALFGPEHGVRGDAQAGDKVASTFDAATGLPVHSLYAATKEPTSEMLAGVDILIFDIQDVGARFYTYPYTLLGVLRAAAKADIPVIVLDRPNPLGGELVEGPVLEPPYASFIGMFAMPVRHGMTMGELATMFVDVEKLRTKLTVIRMKGWRRGNYVFRSGLPWVPPSPNMPTADTALVYPGTALFEGTNVSEGRGTAKPFEQIGAPFIDAAALAKRLNEARLPGVIFRPTHFTPIFSKFSGEQCGGVMLHIIDQKAFRPFLTGVTMVKAVRDLYPQALEFRPGAPSFFDQLAGTDGVRTGILAGDTVAAMQARWQEALKRFKEKRKAYLLY